MKESSFILFSRIFHPSLFIEFNRTKFHIDLIKAVIKCNNVAWSVAPVKTNLKSVKVMLWQTNSVSHGQMAAFTLTSIMSYWVSTIGSNLFGLLKSWICCATQSCLSYYLKTSMLKTVESLALLHHGSLRLHSKITKSRVTNLQKNLKTVVFLKHF